MPVTGRPGFSVGDARQTSVRLVWDAVKFALIADDIPAYAWSAADAARWNPPPSSLARLARRAVP